MPKKPCSWPGCGRFAEVGSRCRVHAAAYRRQTRSANNSFYARKRWRMTRKQKLFETPLCELQGPTCLGLASEVHHRIPLEDGGAEYEEQNLISTCKPCHSRETARAVWGEGREAS